MIGSEALVTLQSVHSSEYVRAGVGEHSYLAASSPHTDVWELFGMKKDSDGTVTLQSVHSSEYVRAGVGEHSYLAATSSHVGAWEKFKLKKNSDGTVALQSVHSSKYVRAGVGEHSFLAAASSHVGAWEKFKLVTTDDLVDDFPGLTSQRGKHKRVVVILWDPKRPNHPAPSRSAVENAFSEKLNSLKQYFNESSLERFSFEVVAFLPPEGPGNPDWYPAKRPAEHYWGEADPTDADGDGFTSGHTEKWAEAIWAASADFDFSAYDYNRNGKLDPNDLLVCMLIPQNNLAGFQRTPSGQQHPVKKPLRSAGVNSGVEIPTILEVYMGNPHAGFLFHEFAHLLVDAGDMYQGETHDSEYVPFSAGPFSVMAAGFPSNLDPFHRLKYDWLKYRVALRSGHYALKAAVPHGETLVLIDLRHSDQEYFLLENRWKTKNTCDANLPDQGLAVWHVIEDPAVYNASPTPTGTSPAYWAKTLNHWGKRGVRLIRPVVTPPTTRNDQALWDGGQPATGYDLLSNDPNQNHSELRWAGITAAGTPSGFAIRNISQAGPVIEFDIEVPW